MDFESLFSAENIEWLKQQAAVNHSPWVIAGLALIPFCVLLFLRELWCWFFKLNQINRSLRQIESHLRTQVDFIESQKRTQAERRQTMSPPCFPIDTPETVLRLRASIRILTLALPSR